MNKKKNIRHNQNENKQGKENIQTTTKQKWAINLIVLATDY